MTDPLTLTCAVPPRCPRRSRRVAVSDATPQPAPVPAGRVPRVARWMALALRFEQLLRAGVVADYAALARLGHVSRARMTQVMNLLSLAPDLQEALLFWPPTRRGRDPIVLRDLQPITALLDWREQRRRWPPPRHRDATAAPPEQQNLEKKGTSRA